MHERVKDYLEDVIVPLIAEHSPEVAEQVTISVGGSYGSGDSDEFSDLDCSVNVPDELVWANMFQAWDNPRWHETIAEAKKRAVQAGYDPSSWTIWTYWGWTDEEPNEGMTHDTR